MNRKGQEIAITLFVLMVFAIFSYAWFTFYMNSDKISEKVFDASMVGEGTSAERNVQTEIKMIAYTRAIDAYSSAVVGKEDLQLRGNKFADEFNGKVELENLPIKSKQVIFNVSANNISAELVEESIFASRKQILGKVGQSWTLGLFDFAKPSSVVLDAALGYYRTSRSKIMFGLNEIGLDDLNYIKETVKDCKSSDNMETCISEKLANFNVKVDLTPGSKKVSFSTKNLFYVGGELKAIKFDMELA